MPRRGPAHAPVDLGLTSRPHAASGSENESRMAKRCASDTKMVWGFWYEKFGTLEELIETLVVARRILNYFPGPDGSETEGTRWNSIQVYRRVGDQWCVIHVHWSFTKHPAFDNMALQG
jgi:hypothetical protein